jgi:hypothetical protein
MISYLGKLNGKEHELVKIGCDYNHSWDYEAGFPHGLNEVVDNAKHSIDMLIAMFPRRRVRCAYSGQWDDHEKFYTARNGERVHCTNETHLRESGWDAWLPC